MGCYSNSDCVSISTMQRDYFHTIHKVACGERGQKIGKLDFAYHDISQA